MSFNYKLTVARDSDFFFFNLNFYTVPSMAAPPQKEQWLTSKLSGLEGAFYDLERC